MTRPIPPVNIKDYAAPGEVEVVANEKAKELKISIHFAAVMINQQETTKLIQRIIQEGYTLWGEEFMAHMNYLMRKEV